MDLADLMFDVLPCGVIRICGSRSGEPECVADVSFLVCRGGEECQREAVAPRLPGTNSFLLYVTGVVLGS